MIDFYKINDFGSGQVDSFQELIKVLARREEIDHSIEYQPNDGRGGDGGVEAIWILSNGSKIAYQAKFFANKEMNPGRWRQMDDSLKSALKTHPEITKYIFALPFDFTPDRGPKTKGSQQQKWNDHVEEWKRLAKEKSIYLDFEFWGATALTDKLMMNENKFLYEHWFNEQILDPSWFEKQVLSSVERLGDRFNHDDHVEVSIENLFDTIVRGSKTQERINNVIKELRQYPVPNVDFTKIGINVSQNILDFMLSTWNKLTSMQDEAKVQPDKSWRWLKNVDIVERFYNEVKKIDNQFYSLSKDIKDKNQKYWNEIRSLGSVLYDIIQLFKDKNLEAEEKQCAFVFGKAGAGKSHIFGETASNRVKQGLPTILLLGQDIGDGPFWKQFADLLGISSNNKDDVLELLNIAGERLGKRTLIFFDAINEGTDYKMWKNWLPEVIASVRSYPFLAIAFSCRNVYANHVIPESILNNNHHYWVNGFSSPEEKERAAIQYLDRKGISRPNIPWLSPEFSNPLFLKVVSESLKLQNKTEFPRGLHGIKQLIGLYVDGFILRINMQNLHPNNLSSPLKKLIKKISRQMAHNRCDFITNNSANNFVKEEFGDRLPPRGNTWLDVFVQTGFFRRDPPPDIYNIDPLDQPSDVIRFSFQRFQDFLVADSLVDEICQTKSSEDGINDEFSKSGPLSFLFYDDDPTEYIRPEFSGLIEALSTIYPERLKIEFTKSLPEWKRHWAKEYQLQTAFAKSFSDRQTQTNAFSDDTRELLHKLNPGWVHPLSLLLENSMTVDHPYNATRLHKFLSKLALAVRDSYWTQWINIPRQEEFRQIDRIISWSSSISSGYVDEKHIELASIVLVWSLSTSDNKLRDQATKALTSVFLKHANSFNLVFENMKDCNDPYIIERMYAAAFGACCLDPSKSRLFEYSQLVYDVVFASGKPPIALLTRDYALGIIEIAKYKESINPLIDLNKCYHPFSSSPPCLNLDKNKVEKIAKSSGNDMIFDLVSSHINDFGKNKIPAHVSDFLTTPISQSEPKTREKIRQICYDEIISSYSKRIDAMKSYEESCDLLQKLEWVNQIKDVYEKIEDKNQTSDVFFEIIEENKNNKITIDEAKKKKQDFREKLKNLMSDDEYQRICKEYFKSGGNYECVNVEQCKLWVVKKSYELGWTEKLFPRENFEYQFHSNRSGLDTISEKYQKIALEEIQARLADNFWLLDENTRKPIKYRYTHLDYRRNLEPTILPDNPVLSINRPMKDNWIIKPETQLPDLTERELKKWATQSIPELSIDKNIYRYDDREQKWNLLYNFIITESRYNNKDEAMRNIKMQETQHSNFGLVSIDKINQLSDYLHEVQQEDNDIWRIEPDEYTDGPFMGEAFWRDTWKTGKKINYISGIPIITPVALYQWEHHLDKTLPDGLLTCLPQFWFAQEFGLVSKPGDFLTWYNQAGNEVFKVYKKNKNRQYSAVIESSAFEEYLISAKMKLICLSHIERVAWPQTEKREFYRGDTHRIILDGEEIEPKKIDDEISYEIDGP